MHAALYGAPAGSGAVRCLLCPTECVIAEGRQGSCRVRGNRGGRLVALNYGVVAAQAVDPVEKKPLYHFRPGGLLLSLGPPGCNLHCAFCQNWQISQVAGAEEARLGPEEAVARALELRRADPRVIGLAFTYTDPVIWYEYVLDAARLCRAAGLAVVLKTNGYINPEPLRAWLPWLDALNVDVKAFDDAFYRRVCQGRLQPVLATVEAAVAAGKHVEVTHLPVPGENDDPEQLEALATWLAGISPELPLHLLRYFPNYRLGGAPTPLPALEAMRQRARRHLRHVYIGGTWRAEHASTVCPGCGAVLIRREGFRVRAERLRADGCCAACGRPAPLVGPLHLAPEHGPDGPEDGVREVADGGAQPGDPAPDRPDRA
jgi:pyruvate formate lyase activating enzyme